MAAGAGGADDLWAALTMRIARNPFSTLFRMHNPEWPRQVGPSSLLNLSSMYEEMRLMTALCH